MIGSLARVFLTHPWPVEVTLVAKATVLLLVGLIATRLVRRAPAAARHVILASTFGALVVLPVAMRIAPPVPIAMSIVPSPDADAAPFASQPATSGSDADRGVKHAVPSDQREPRRLGPSSLWTALDVVWSLGACFSLLPVLLSLWELRTVRRTGQPSRTDVGLIVHEFGIRRTVTVTQHERVVAPITFGVVRPVVVLPMDATDWPASELRDALRHECEHVRRSDWLVTLAARIACAAYWFHPLAWLAWRRLRLESECACDDVVVLRAVDPAAYASQLFQLAQRVRAHALSGAVTMAGRSDLARRVGAMLDSSRTRGKAGRVRSTVIAASACGTLVLIAGMTVTSVRGQTIARGTDAAFQTASITRADQLVPTPLSLGRAEIPGPTGQFVGRGMSLDILIQHAYGVSSFQVIGAPDWALSDPFDVVGTTTSEPSRAQIATMLQTLLADRFRLSVHTERRVLPVYTLTRSTEATLGPQLVRSTRDCDAEDRLDLHERLKIVARDGYPLCGRFGRIPYPGVRSAFLLTGRTVTLQQLATQLARADAVDRAVIDQTGLSGAFDIQVSWTPQPDNLGYRTQPPSLAAAVDEQLGLTLMPGEQAVDVLVVDHAERPID